MNRAVTIIGLGNVGKFLTGSLLLMKDLRLSINIMDIDPEVEGAVLDLQHAANLENRHDITLNDQGRFEASDFIFHCAGTPVPKGSSRLVTCESSIEITRTVFNGFQPKKEPFVIVVANPVEVITGITQFITKLPKHKVLGTGTFLDSVRMNYAMRKQLGALHHVNAVLLGEHGDKMFLSEHLSDIDGYPIRHFFDEERKKELLEEVKLSANKIKETQEATIYGVGMCALKLFRALLENDATCYPVCTFLTEDWAKDIPAEKIAISLYASISDKGVFPCTNYHPDHKEWKKLVKAGEHISACLPENN